MPHKLRLILHLTLLLPLGLLSWAADNPPPLVTPSSTIHVGVPQDTEKTVTGNAAGWKTVRLKIFGGTGSLVQRSEAVVDLDDNSFVAGLHSPLAAGQIVVVVGLQDGKEGPPSNPVLVTAKPAPGADPSADKTVTQPVAKPATPAAKPAAGAPAAAGAAVNDAVKQKQPDLTPASTKLFRAHEGDAVIRGYAGTSVKTLKVTIASDTSSIGMSFVGSTAGPGQRINEVGMATLDSTTNTFVFEPKYPLEEGMSLQVQGLDAQGNPLTGETDTTSVESVDLDWGQVRAYFTLGLVLAQNSDEFSINSASPFIDFSLQKNWFWNQPSWLHGLKTSPAEQTSSETAHGWGGMRLDSFFDARLTAIATTATTNKAAGSSSTAVTPSSVLLSRQAASMQMGVYAPMIFNHYSFSGRSYSLFAAPLTKVGFYTPTSSGPVTNSSADTTATPTSNTRFYPFFTYGARVGHFADSSNGSELLSYLDIGVGRFGNFEYTTAACGATAATDPCLRQRLLRYSFEGVIKVPHTPLILGMSANIAAQRSHNPQMFAPQDDLRFLLGAKFDARRLVGGLFNSRSN